jgi:hypothetical protein
MILKQRWLITAAIAFVAFGAGLLTYSYVEYQKPHFVPEVVRIESYAVAATDESDLRLLASVGEGDRLGVPIITEEADRVIVKLQAFRFVPESGGLKNLAAYSAHARAFLRQPIGARRVIDATTGQVVPRAAAQP